MRESSTDIHTLPSVNRQRVGSCCITQALSLVLCDEPEEWDGDGVEGRLEREGAFLLLFSRSIVSSFLWPHGLPHARLPCPSQSPGVCSSLCPLSWWCYLIISFLAPSSSFVFNLSQHTYIPEDICIPKLIHVVQQTPIPHCKAITLQLKTNLKKTPLKNVKKKKKDVCVCVVYAWRERGGFLRNWFMWFEVLSLTFSGQTSRLEMETQGWFDVMISSPKAFGGRIPSSSGDLELPWWLVLKNPPANTGD